ncbi:MAG: formiminotransferase-cyclodeaminase [bacterium]|nr:MAG: formiminotransferase-cyclodeaminase [bacterium]
MYLKSPFHTFFTDLASEKSSPGGGSVAALTGVQAVSLVLMVCRLTLGKKKYLDVESQIETMIEKASTLKESLLGKVEEDIIIFQEIMDTYKLEASQREEPLKKALKKSAYFSFSMVEEACQILQLAKQIGEIGNKNLISDAAIAVILSISTMEASAVNVRINLKSLNSEEVTQDIETQMKGLFITAYKLKEEAFEVISRSIQVSNL